MKVLCYVTFALFLRVWYEKEKSKTLPLFLVEGFK